MLFLIKLHSNGKSWTLVFQTAVDTIVSSFVYNDILWCKQTHIVKQQFQFDHRTHRDNTIYVVHTKHIRYQLNSLTGSILMLTLSLTRGKHLHISRTNHSQTRLAFSPPLKPSPSSPSFNLKHSFENNSLVL